MPVCDWAHVYFNPDDEITWWSSLLLGNLWGDMGKTGFRLKGERLTRAETSVPMNELRPPVSVRVRQVDTMRDADYFDVPAARGHLAIFQRPCVEPWGRVVGRRILSEITT
jgi:hypothetical protein